MNGALAQAYALYEETLVNLRESNDPDFDRHSVPDRGSRDF